MSLWTFLWASTAWLLSLGFLGPFANSTLPWVFLLTSLGFPGPITLFLSLGFIGLPQTPYSLNLHCLGPMVTLSRFSTSYTAHGMPFLSFRASLSPLASSRPICLFVRPVIHYSCRLSLMGFCYLFYQFFVALIIGLSFCLGFPQMALNIPQTIKGQPSPSLKRSRFEWATFGCQFLGSLVRLPLRSSLQNQIRSPTLSLVYALFL